MKNYCGYVDIEEKQWYRYKVVVRCDHEPTPMELLQMVVMSENIEDMEIDEAYDTSEVLSYELPNREDKRTVEPCNNFYKNES